MYAVSISLNLTEYAISCDAQQLFLLLVKLLMSHLSFLQRHV